MLHMYFCIHSPNSSPTPIWGLLAYPSTILAAAAFHSSVAASNTLQPHWKFLKAKNDFWCFLSDPFRPYEPNADEMVAVTK